MLIIWMQVLMKLVQNWEVTNRDGLCVFQFHVETVDISFHSCRLSSFICFPILKGKIKGIQEESRINPDE